MEEKLFLVVTYQFHRGHRAAFLQQIAQAGLCEFFRTEPGCERYEYLLPEDPDRLVLLEQWHSAADQLAHSLSPRMDTLREIKERYVCATELRRFSPLG